MARKNADTNSQRNTARAARSRLMARSFPASCHVVALRSAPDRPAEPVADAGEHQDIRRQHGPPQQGNLLPEHLALLLRMRLPARPEAALDHRDQWRVDEG